MKDLKLGAQLNISFALVLFVPMIIAAVFSIAYYSQKIEEEAINKISSDLKSADIIFRNALVEVKNLASAYGQKETVRALVSLNLGEKLGTDLKKSYRDDNLNLISVVGPDGRILVRAHAPDMTGDELGNMPEFVVSALTGNASSGIEVIGRDTLVGEGIDGKTFQGNQVLSITGVAPVYHREGSEVVGAIIVRRLLGETSPMVQSIARELDVNTALFENVRLIAKGLGKTSGAFADPHTDMLNTVLKNNVKKHEANITRDGSISEFMPVTDFEGTPVGILMVQTGVGTYITTRNTAVISLVVIFVTGFILAFAIKTIIERRILIPVLRLRQAAEKIGDGQYDQTLTVTSGDEIGELTDTFNRMAFELNEYDRKLKEYNAQLEDRVRERTAELEISNNQLVKANSVLEDTLEILNPGISKLIGNNQQQLGLVFATELVADVCNYTKLNMILGETMMGEFMKKFFRESHKLLAQYRGMFDKTVGDQIVAIFGTPKDDMPASPLHPFDAVSCALKLVAAANKINEVMQTAIQDNYTAIVSRHKSLSSEDRENAKIEDLRFQCRVGINTSNPSSDREIDRMRMVMMGAETCVDYTAQGGSIIYAFRLESNGIPGEVHIGENTKRLVEHVFLLEELPPITLKGLGLQSRYHVDGAQFIFENIYPKTKIFTLYCSNIPNTLVDFASTLKVGKIQLPEVRKINEFLEIDIPYLEHIAGFHHLSISRALFSYAVAESLNMETEKLDAILFTTLWVNSLQLRNHVLGVAHFYSIEDRCPETIDAKYVEKIVDDMYEPRQTIVESKIIAMCNRFDLMVFDRTYLKKRSQEIKSAKEVVTLLRIEEQFDEFLIAILEELMVAPEEEREDPDRLAQKKAVVLPNNPAHIAATLIKNLTSEQQEDLISQLREAGKHQNT